MASETEEFEFRARAEAEAKPTLDHAPTVNDIPGQVAASGETPLTLKDKVVGPAEAALSMGSGMVAAPLGAAAGVASNLTSGKFGTKEGLKKADDTAGTVTDALTYKPRTEGGKQTVKAYGDISEATKLAGLGPAEAFSLGRVAPAVSEAVQTAKTGTGAALQKGADLMTRRAESPAMAGVGAAMSDAEKARHMRAAGMDVPIKLMKGQGSRKFEDIQFERETAKHPEAGADIRQRYAEQNQDWLRNFDAWGEQTGAQAPTLRAAGKVIDAAFVTKAKAAKGKIDAAYKSARESGEMEQAVSIAPIQEYLEKNAAASVNAGVIDAAKRQLVALSKDGKMTLNELEEARQMVGTLGGKDAPNGHFAGEIKRLIDQSMEGATGEKFKYARGLRRKYADEFENVGVVDKLLSTKPGSKDRAVAFEDVVGHIYKSDLDSVRHIRKVLQTAGEEGKQAWKELQGAGIKEMKEAITTSAVTDANGNRIVNPQKFDNIVRDLDADGRLDFIYGKKGAEKIRDARDAMADALTAPPGSVNSSNTASILFGLLDTAVSGVSGLPLPIASGTNYAIKKLKQRALNKRVQEHLNPPIGQDTIDRAGVNP